MKTHTSSAALATVALLCIAGHAQGQGFSDDFNDGDLDGWGSPYILFDQQADSFRVSAEGGVLRMEGVGNSSSQQPEIVFLPLVASQEDSGVYRNGAVAYDLDLDAYSQAATMARFDEAAGTYVLLHCIRNPGGGRIAVAAVENGQFVSGDYKNLSFSFEHISVEASWMGEEISLRVTNRDTHESGSVSITAPSAFAGGDTGLAVTRDRPDIFEFGATFDNFWLCPADCNGDGILDTRDFIAFLNAWVLGTPLADWDGNGAVNTLDFLAYLNQWASGC